MTPHHPDITLQLTGEDGNALAILGRAVSAARKAGLASDEINTFRKEALRGDYNQLLQTCMARFSVQ